MEETSYYLAGFETSQGKTLRLRIGRARPGVSAGEARAALAEIAAANALEAGGGSLAGVRDLRFVTVRKTPFAVL